MLLGYVPNDLAITAQPQLQIFLILTWIFLVLASPLEDRNCFDIA